MDLVFVVESFWGHGMNVPNGCQRRDMAPTVACRIGHPHSFRGLRRFSELKFRCAQVALEAVDKFATRLQC